MILLLMLLFNLPTLNSINACSKAFAFFCPTFAGSFIFCERNDTPVPRSSLNLIPALSTAYREQNKNIGKLYFLAQKVLFLRQNFLTLTTESTRDGRT